MRKQAAGVVHIIPLVVIAVFLTGTLYSTLNEVTRKKIKDFFRGGNLELVEATPTPTDSPTPSPTESPTPTVSPTASPAMTPTAPPVATAQPVSGPPASGVSTITIATQLGNFKATIASIDLNSARVITDTASDSDCYDNCPSLSLSDYVARNGGFAGVNGTYFCPSTYPECAGKTNSTDFPVYNSRLGRWLSEGTLFWGGRSMVYFDGSGAHYLQNASSFSGGLTAGIVNYPGLLANGNVQIDDSQSGLSYNQRAVGTKVGIGVRGLKNVMVVVAYNVNMQQFAHVFKSLGADGALNLDTGGSAALWYGGYRVGPGRSLPNAIVFQ